MKKTDKFIIAMEELVVQEFEITADCAEDAMKIAKEQYEKGGLVLSPGEVQLRQMAVVKPKMQATGWYRF